MASPSARNWKPSLPPAGGRSVRGADAPDGAALLEKLKQTEALAGAGGRVRAFPGVASAANAAAAERTTSWDTFTKPQKRVLEVPPTVHRYATGMVDIRDPSFTAEMQAKFHQVNGVSLEEHHAFLRADLKEDHSLFSPQKKAARAAYGTALNKLVTLRPLSAHTPVVDKMKAQALQRQKAAVNGVLTTAGASGAEAGGAGGSSSGAAAHTSPRGASASPTRIDSGSSTFPTVTSPSLPPEDAVPAPQAWDEDLGAEIDFSKRKVAVFGMPLSSLTRLGGLAGKMDGSPTGRRAASAGGMRWGRRGQTLTSGGAPAVLHEWGAALTAPPPTALVKATVKPSAGSSSTGGGGAAATSSGGGGGPNSPPVSPGPASPAPPSRPTTASIRMSSADVAAAMTAEANALLHANTVGATARFVAARSSRRGSSGGGEQGQATSGEAFPLRGGERPSTAPSAGLKDLTVEVRPVSASGRVRLSTGPSYQRYLDDLEDAVEAYQAQVNASRVALHGTLSEMLDLKWKPPGLRGIDAYLTSLGNPAAIARREVLDEVRGMLSTDAHATAEWTVAKLTLALQAVKVAKEKEAAEKEKAAKNRALIQRL